MAKKSDPRETPMMRQYIATKAEHPDAMLFMRMGDFFEVFLDDAVEAAKLLGITLTSRNKGKEDEVPMAGVPHRSLQGYLPKLLEHGIKVAIMDQLEDPSEAKGLVKRGLTRIITPGTLLDEDALDDAQANYLVAITGFDAPIGIAALDCSTGEFLTEQADSSQQLSLALARLQASEIIIPETLAQNEFAHERIAELSANPDMTISPMSSYAWRAADARQVLCERYQISELDGFGIGPQDDHLCSAAAAALRYANEHAFDQLKHLRHIRRIYPGQHLIMDAVCQRNLDLLRNSRDNGKQGTLLHSIDRTRTAPGARLLAAWIARPLAEAQSISDRHDAVAALLKDNDARENLRDALEAVYDLERLLARVATGRCHARDLVQLAQTLEASKACQDLMQGQQWPALINADLSLLNPAPELTIRIQETLVEDPPLVISDGGMIRDGIDAGLDEVRAIKRDANTWLAAYQARESEACQIPKMKVGYNKVFGYYIEIGKAHTDKVPEHFIRKQTLVNAERYITPELKEYEEKALSAEDTIRSKELAIFGELRDLAESYIGSIQRCADALARLDVFACFADNAHRLHWCRPIVDESHALRIGGGRHPVVERVIGRDQFVANDCLLQAGAQDDAHYLAIITGPNMAGKSTYIRQVALAVILAQSGSFIPADEAHIGLVDRLFTRVGAGDELSRNMSTFMVEMAETAAILNNATHNSLVILDEVGRGTSTYDGVSLAWAITEHIHDSLHCRCLFATHYHELTSLAKDMAGVQNLTVAVAEENNDVVFLHKIIEGAATKSYGIHVAQLAGVPVPVIERARFILEHLEESKEKPQELQELKHTSPPPAMKPDNGQQLEIFATMPSPILDRLRQLPLDDYSPRQALDQLYKLQQDALKES